MPFWFASFASVKRISGSNGAGTTPNSPTLAVMRFGRTAGRFGLEFADRFHSAGARLGHQHDRAALEAEGFSQFAREKLHVRVGKQLVAIDEHNECRRCLPDLRGIKKLQPMADGTDWLPFFNGVIQGAV